MISSGLFLSEALTRGQQWGGCDPRGPGKETISPSLLGKPHRPMAADVKCDIVFTIASFSGIPFDFHRPEVWNVLKAAAKFPRLGRSEPHKWTVEGEASRLITRLESTPGSKWPLSRSYCQPRRGRQCTLDCKALVKCLDWQFSFSSPQGQREANWVKELNRGVCLCVWRGRRFNVCSRLNAPCVFLCL